MSDIFEIQIDKTKMTGRMPSKGLELPKEAEKALADCMLFPAEEMTNFLNNVCTLMSPVKGIWLVIALDREYRVLGHVSEFRKNTRSIGLAKYSTERFDPVDEENIPGISAIYIESKDALATLTTDSPLFRHMWEEMKDLDEEKQWLYISDPLDEKLVEPIEKIDDEKVLKLFNTYKGPAIQPVQDHEAYEALMEARTAGNPAEAMKHAEVIHKAFPDRAAATFELAKEYELQNKRKQAEALYRKAIKQAETHIAEFKQPRERATIVYRPQGDLKYSFHERYRNQRLCLAESITMGALAWNSLGGMFFANKELGAALKACTSALEMDPDCIQAMRNKGIVMLELGLKEEAVTILEESMEKDPTEESVIMLLGSILLDLDRHEEALETLQKLMLIDPENTRARIMISQAYMKLSNTGRIPREEDQQKEFVFIKNVLLEAAHTHTKAAVEKNPKSAEAWFFHGVACQRLDRHTHSIIAYKEAIKHNPDLSIAWTNMAIAYHDLGLSDPALKAATKATVLEPEEAATWRALGKVMMNGDTPAKAVDAFSKALAITPDDPYLLEMMVKACKKAEDEPLLRATYKHLEAIDPEKAKSVGAEEDLKREG